MENIIYTEISKYLFTLGDAIRQGRKLIDLMDSNWENFVTEETEEAWEEIITELQTMQDHMDIGQSILAENMPE